MSLGGWGGREVTEYTPVHVSPLFPLNARKGWGWVWVQHYTGRHKQYSLKSSSGETSHFRVIFLSSILFFLLLLSMRERITLNSSRVSRVSLYLTAGITKQRGRTPRGTATYIQEVLPSNLVRDNDDYNSVFLAVLSTIASWHSG